MKVLGRVVYSGQSNFLMRATDIFTPADYPKYTYVTRSADNLELRLRDALDTPGRVISISGPSKTGKTAMVKTVVGEDDLIEVNASSIEAADEVWSKVLDWADVPDSISETSSSTVTDQSTRTIGGQFGAPGTGVNASGAFLSGTTDGGTRGTVRARGGLDQVIRTFGDTPFTIFIDDFHYMPVELQTEVAKQVKAAAGNRLRIIIASVPHRSEDVVRSNAELIGRTANLDLQFWGAEDLAKIAIIGFPQLNVLISPTIAEAMAIEACGSPQLMQELCLQSCFVADYREASEQSHSLVWDPSFKRKVLEQAAENTSRSDVLTAMHRGAKIRGMPRKTYNFFDSSVGDVYTAVLLAIKIDPPIMEISYTDLIERVQKVCLPDNYPSSSSIVAACQQLEVKAKLIRPKERIVEWASRSSTLSIVDPYFLFYLRSSGKLKDLSRARQAVRDLQQQSLPFEEQSP